jgi:hypothetical protein
MQNNEDGSVTLTKQEFAKLNKAYQALYEIIDRMPSFLGDYLERKSDYLNIEKWQCLLSRKKFNRKDYE